MNEEIERNRAAVQRHTGEGQQSAVRALQQYVANRRLTLSHFERMDPHSQHTRDAEALLLKAIKERDEYVALVAPPASENPPSELQKEAPSDAEVQNSTE